ncbi:MAG TPA: hypothetical protein VM870_00545 [Pyrinomonadaceae bacterium]|nr:hypothetical protein [Pyrinomonadaceae bacterium]
MAWQFPPHWVALERGAAAPPAADSSVLREQARLMRSTRRTLAAIAADVGEGLRETVGIDSSLSEVGGRCSIVIELPPAADHELIARAIDLENIEAWRDENTGNVHVAVGPWYSTKDVDQVVLTVTKVVHVLLGLHAAGAPQTLGQRLLVAVRDVILLQKSLSGKKN